MLECYPSLGPDCVWMREAPAQTIFNHIATISCINCSASLVCGENLMNERLVGGRRGSSVDECLRRLGTPVPHLSFLSRTSIRWCPRMSAGHRTRLVRCSIRMRHSLANYCRRFHRAVALQIASIICRPRAAATTELFITSAASAL